jgi:hypothetical protein
MEPNKIINKLYNKWLFCKYATLYLYQIKYDTYIKNYDIIDEIFPNHFLVLGYKKLILESTGK